MPRQIPKYVRLERNVVWRHVAFAVATGAAALLLGSFGLQHFHAFRDHIPGCNLHAVLISVLTRGHAPLDIHFGPLVKITVACLSELVPGNDVEPLGFFSALTSLAIFCASVDSQRKLGNCLTALR